MVYYHYRSDISSNARAVIARHAEESIPTSASYDGSESDISAESNGLSRVSRTFVSSHYVIIVSKANIVF